MLEPMQQPMPALRCALVRWSLVLLLGALASPSAGDPAQPHGSREIPNTSILGVEELEHSTHAETFAALRYVDDPIEPVNRFGLRITKPAVDWVLVPLAKGYRYVTPAPLRRSLDRFSYNLTYPGRLVSLLLQAKLRKSAEETAHFLTNTMLGFVGFFDPASGLGVRTYPEDVGQSFARWGLGPGFYLFVPFIGPSSGRDAVGRVFDTALNPLTWLPVPGVNAFFGVNAFSFRIDGYETLDAAFPDLYLPARALWSIQRQVEIEDYEIPAEAYDNADPEPSLGVLALELDDPTFPRRSAERLVALPAHGTRLPYSLWLQEQPAPLLFLIPGVGAHRLSRLPVALAEMAFQYGYSVAVVSSPFHPEFIANALSVDYPGYTPSDAEDLYHALSAIWQDLRAERPDGITSASLLGYSLGGIETLFIAAREDQRPGDSLRFESYTAINPPVDLLYAGRQFDAFFDAPLRWPEAVRAARIRELVMKAFVMLQDGLPENVPLPFDRTESEFLVGFSGRVTVADTLRAVEQRGAPGLEVETPVDGRQATLLDSILRSSFLAYFEQLALPYFAQREAHRLDGEALVESASLRSLGTRLQRNPRVAIVTNADDFILGEPGLEWLRANAGDRLTVFPTGGHLGNVGRPEFQEAVLGTLAPVRARLN